MTYLKEVIKQAGQVKAPFTMRELGMDWEVQSIKRQYAGDPNKVLFMYADGGSDDYDVTATITVLEKAELECSHTLEIPMGAGAVIKLHWYKNHMLQSCPAAWLLWWGGHVVGYAYVKEPVSNADGKLYHNNYVGGVKLGYGCGGHLKEGQSFESLAIAQEYVDTCVKQWFAMLSQQPLID